MGNLHPSRDIIGSKSSRLDDRKVALCITGSVAAAKSPEIARELMREGAEVFPIMSKMAQKIIHPDLMEWATGNPVLTELSGEIEHVALANDVDLVLVAPATANTISKMACGIDDTPVTTVISAAFGTEPLIMVVPAMHESMYNHPIVVENIKRLKSLGVEFIGPRIKEGKAKIAEVSEIVQTIVDRLTIQRDLIDKKVLVTAGPTIEYLDPIRVMTNRSSGKMGVAITAEALSRGADVTLVYGAGTAIPPARAKVHRVETSQEMHDAVADELKSRKYDIMLAVAAVSDWTPEKRYQKKIPTANKTSLNVTLKPTPKIIDIVKIVSPHTFLVGFRAQHELSNEKLIQSAYRRLKKANADLIVANDIGRNAVGLNHDTNEIFIVDSKRKVVHVPLTSKKEAARKLFDVIVDKIIPRSEA